MMKEILVTTEQFFDIINQWFSPTGPVGTCSTRILKSLDSVRMRLVSELVSMIDTVHAYFYIVPLHGLTLCTSEKYSIRSTW